MSLQGPVLSGLRQHLRRLAVCLQMQLQLSRQSSPLRTCSSSLPSPQRNSRRSSSLAPTAALDLPPRKHSPRQVCPAAKISSLAATFALAAPSRGTVQREHQYSIMLPAAWKGCFSLRVGQWHVVMAVRDFSRTEKAVKAAGLSKDSYSLSYLDLASQTSVRQFVEQFRYLAAHTM